MKTCQIPIRMISYNNSLYDSTSPILKKSIQILRFELEEGAKHMIKGISSFIDILACHSLKLIQLTTEDEQSDFNNVLYELIPISLDMKGV